MHSGSRRAHGEHDRPEQFTAARLPYRRMLIITGILLGGVLLVMVGERAQEMHSRIRSRPTPIPALESFLRP
ncbi:MAG: hypothetical protein ABI674_00555 [Spartobacteria bacterium]